MMKDLNSQLQQHSLDLGKLSFHRWVRCNKISSNLVNTVLQVHIWDEEI